MFEQDETINFSIEQKKSGLNSVNVTINGTSLTEDKNGKSLTDANRIYKDVQQEMTTKDTFVISTSQVSAVGDGDYEIKIAVTANVDEKDVYTIISVMSASSISSCKISSLRRE